VPSGCSGSVASPGASPGNLCIFQGWASNTSTSTGRYDAYDPIDGNPGAGTTGAVVYFYGASAGAFDTAGTFAVTAP
jgi:hypothetical protein